MKVLVTGANGFVGKNLIEALRGLGHEVLEFDVESTLEELNRYTMTCEVVFHLAGVCRPQRIEEFKSGNVDLTIILLEYLRKNNNRSSIVFSSSIQAVLDTEYGKTKREAELKILEDEHIRGVNNYIFRLPNLFGKWSRPNYNSVMATFCYNIAHGLPIVIHDRNTILTLAHIGDVVKAFINTMEKKVEKKEGFCVIPTCYKKSLGEIADMIYSFASPGYNVLDAEEFEQKLFYTYLTYLNGEV